MQYCSPGISPTTCHVYERAGNCDGLGLTPNECNTYKPLNQNGRSVIAVFWSPRETKYRSQIWVGGFLIQKVFRQRRRPVTITLSTRAGCLALLLRVRPSIFSPSSLITLVLGLWTQIRSEYMTWILHPPKCPYPVKKLLQFSPSALPLPSWAHSNPTKWKLTFDSPKCKLYVSIERRAFQTRPPSQSNYR